MKLIVTSPSAKLEDRVKELEAQVEGLAKASIKVKQDADDLIKEERETSDKELTELKAALKWSLAQLSVGKMPTKAKAEETITKVLGEDDDSNGTDSRA